MMAKRYARVGGFIFAAAAFCAAAEHVNAQSEKAFPARSITLVVPFPAGGPSDAVARAVSQSMAIDLGQSIVVENIGGAGGTIGLAKFIKLPPDGYTIAYGTVGTHVANVALYKKLPYDPVADFDPIGPVAAAPVILVARSTLPAVNLAEFVTYAKANLAKVDVLGLNEGYGDFVADLRRRFGWWPSGLNSPARTNVSSEPWAVSEALRRQIARDNALDLEFYDYARQLVEQRRRDRLHDATLDR